MALKRISNELAGVQETVNRQHINENFEEIGGTLGKAVTIDPITNEVQVAGAALEDGKKAAFRAGMGIFPLSSPVSIELMASPPTITVSADGAATSIADGQTVAVNMIVQWPTPPGGTMYSPNIIDNSPEGAGHTGATLRAPCSFFVMTDATQIELSHRPDGANSDFVLFVDDQRASGNIAGSAFNGQTKRVLVDFGGNRKTRLLEFSGLRVPPDSFRIGAKDSIQFPVLPAASSIVIGDSFAEGTGAECAALGVGSLVMKCAGLRKNHISGLGGTGFSGTSTGLRKRLRYRWETDIAPFPGDFIIFMSGVNDSAATYAQLLNDATAAFDLADASHPEAIKIVFPGFNPKNSLPTITRDAIRDAVGIRKKYVFIDSYAAGEITGTGYVNGQSSGGNSNWVIGGTSGADQTHPTPDGHFYLSDWRGRKIREVLGAI